MDEKSICSGMPETEITALKEALQSQQKLLQQLYTELDEEREASATATSEALSMILRLQGEKASVKMEASQYKRMAEEKMCHAEESLAIFEDLMYQKEMEISALEFQVQSYKCKLLSMGCTDLVVGETRSLENPSQQNSDAQVGDNNLRGIGRRNSLPPLWLKDPGHKKSVIEKERSVILSPDWISKIVEENTVEESDVHIIDLEKKFENTAVGNFDSYWERIKKLDEKVKEISDCKDSGKGKSANLKDGSRSSSLYKQASIGTSFYPMREHPQNLLETEVTVSSPCFSSVHDIFEVPVFDKNHKGCEWQKKDQAKFISEYENRLGKPESVYKEAPESYVEDETDRIKKMLRSTNNEKKSLKSIDEVGVDCHLASVQPTISVAESQAEIQQLSRRLEQLENERRTVRHEISNVGEEELELLKEMREQLNSIQSEIRSWRTKKSPPSNDDSLVSVMEAMLHFWL